MYVPILKWKQGEYLALEKLEADIKNQVKPLAEIPPIGWDFARGCLSKTIDEHLEKFSYRLHKKWRKRDIFIDLALLDPADRMGDGKHPLTYLFDGIINNNDLAIPVTGLSRSNSYQAAVKTAAKECMSGICIRLSFEDIVGNDLNTRLQTLASLHEIDLCDIDIILDLDAPNFHPIDKFSRILYLKINEVESFLECRSFTIAATSFPDTMGKLKKGHQTIERSEWLLYNTLLAKFNESEQAIQFGDYGIAHPSLPAQDMRLLKPAASLRYTIDDAWYIGKGTNVRDNGYGQYADICSSLIDSGHFLGKSYSDGDSYIYKCGKSLGSTGNLTSWRRVGTNHHITKVVRDLANVYAT